MREFIGEYGQTILSIVGAILSIGCVGEMLHLLTPLMGMVLENMM